MQVDGMTAMLARDLRLAGKFRLWRRKLINPPLVGSHLVLPPVGILAPIAAGNTSGTTHGQVDLSPALVQLLGDLRPRLPTAHHQHRTIGQRLWIAVLIGMNLLYLMRKVRIECWNLWLLVQPSSDDHVVCLEMAN